ncbi:MAG: hydantoinase/oxoprolinase family protein [Thermoplasmatales archaeon]|nr:hydantoinase/oxoprolinase family protein [Thermoplasmatales archaeon]
MSLGLGFDTGGTYTDAIILDFDTGKILQKAKSLTTYDDLSVGIDSSIHKLDPDLLKQVAMVSMSSTLATNSVVEGRGGRVGLVSMGLEYSRSVSVEMYCSSKGRFNLYGGETEAVEEGKIREFLKSAKGKIDSLAVSGYLSVRNPHHEKRVKAMSDEILGIPVVCGHELSSNLGFEERAVTAVMNARLLPLIRELITSVKRSLANAGIDAPLMVVKGDGSLMTESLALDRPIETIISGPAASLIGAKTLSGRDDAIVIDMGGTTTDIGVLRNGQPRLESEGAMIGGKRTKVLAANIATTGLGGDSRIVTNNRRIYIGPKRAIPLCIASSQWPCIREKLSAIEKDSRERPRNAHTYEGIIYESEFFIPRGPPVTDFMGEKDCKFFELIHDEPLSIPEVSRMTGIHPLSFKIARMEKAGVIQRIGFTPTDILHADGTYREYDVEASKMGAKYMSFIMNLRTEDFLAQAKSRFVDRLAEALVKDLVIEETGMECPTMADTDFMSKSISGKFGKDYGCFMRFNKPIIGIGAPVNAYFPEMAKKFDAELLLLEDSDVGNAIVAVKGSIVESMTIVVKPMDDRTEAEDPRSMMIAPFDKKEFTSLSHALEYAEKYGSVEVLRIAKGYGAVNPSVTVRREDQWLGGNKNSGVLVETYLHITAVGKPKFAGQ